MIVECVPNFSEGRNAATLDAIAAALTGVTLLGRTADVDHNRSVFTLAGEAKAVLDAAVRAVGVAVERIDLTQQVGVHPRIGAADVVPFVPVQGATMEDCIEIAWEAGAEIWRRFGVGVHFYEAAAKVPEKRRLEVVRRGGFAPDLGAPHPTAGATVVGARHFLIAYNLNLTTSDVAIAKAIATKIRTSSGGLPCVKALGLFLESRGIAQVSMNLTDFAVTSVDEVYAAVEAEAAAYGVGILEPELIGFIPRAAVGRQSFRPNQILEDKLGI
ncbi:glutamate formimidoyltransferase [Bryobacter aggregatus]|uniref:glutamate formimidoyltransferase n=1 Tax=Bryobacter aggregatus TaxID=360054 RepID=UPI0004E0CC79|nr:glutamate formimidoyltransferase [Bryobacter aggregatus]